MDYKKYYKKNTKIERDLNIDIQESQLVDKVIYIFLLLTLLIVPLFIKQHIGPFFSPDVAIMGSSLRSDVFSYYKYIFLVIFTVVLVLLFMYKLLFLKYPIKRNSIYLFLGILAVFITLSTVFSPHKSIALYGMYNRKEGALTFLSYLAIFFVAANTTYTKKQLQGLLYILYPFVIINAWLGWEILNGKNVLDIGWLNKFIIGKIPEGAEVSGDSQIWATLSNPNYISGIGSVLTVMFLTWAIFDKSKTRSLINIIFAILSFLTVLISFSTSGFITIIVLLPIIIILIFLNKQKVKSWVVLIIFVIVATSIYVPLANKNPRIWDESFGFFIKDNPFNNDQLSLKVSKSIVSKNGLKNVFLPSKVYAEDKTTKSIKFEMPIIPEPGFSAGSGRLYIWEKSIEIAKRRPILGYGLDTFTFVFPQNDIGKISGLGTYNVIADKPHNMYLGLLMGSGIISLLTFIAFAGAVLLKGAKNILSQKNINSSKPVLLALFVTSIAYLVQGIINDSVVGSAVIFWVLLGVLAANANKTEVTGE